MQRTQRTAHLVALLLAVPFIRLSAPLACAGTLTKASSGTDLTAGASWTGGTAPGSADVATWDTGSLGTGLTLNSGTPSWLGIKVSAGASAPISIGSGGTLTLGTGGIDMSAAVVNATIGSGLTLGTGAQVWNVASGRTLTLNTGAFVRGGAGNTLNLQGSGIFSSSMTGISATGDSSTPTQSGSSIIGPWITTGTGSSTAYGILVGGNIIPYTSATAQAWTGTFVATANYDINATTAATFGGSTRSCNTARYVANGACTVTCGNSANGAQFIVNGIVHAGTGLLTFNTAGSGTAGMVVGPNKELIINAANAAITISTPIHNNSGGASAVTVIAPNLVTFSGASDFTGNLSVNSGTVAAGLGLGDPGTATSQGSALGNIGTAASRSIIVNNGGILSLTAGNTLGTGGSANTLSAITLVVNAGGVFQSGANASGAGWWNKIGAINLNGGTIHVGSGANNSAFQGLALIGTVTVGGSSASTIDNLPSSDSGYNAIHLGQNATANQSITFNVADVTGNANPDLIITAKLRNTSSTQTASGLTKTGAGTMVLSGANSYSGATTVNAGRLVFSTAGSGASAVTVSSGTCGVSVAAANGQWINTSDVILQNGTELDMDSGSFIPSTTTAPMKVANFTANGANTLKVIGSGNFAVGSSYPLVTWTGNGPTDASAFSSLVLPSIRMVGNLSVSGNTLYLNVTGNTEPLSWNTGNGTWDTTTANWVDSAVTPATATYIDGSDSVLFGDASGVSGNPTVMLNATVLPVGVTVNSASHNYLLSGSGSISGSGSLTVQKGTLTLATANSYTGGTTISGGTLQISGSGNLGGSIGSLTTSGGILDLAGTSQSVGPVIISGGTIQNGTVTGAGTTANNATSANVSAVLGGPGGLTKSANGTLTLSGANTYSGGTIVSGGTLTLSGSGTLGSSANTLSISGGTLDLGAATVTAGAVTISGGTIQNGTLTGTSYTANNSGAATVGAVLAGASVNLAMSGSGTLTLSGANTFSGTVTLNSGTIVSANPTALSSAARVNLPGNATGTLSVRTDGGDTAIKLGLGTGTTVFNLVSDRATPGVGISHPLSVLAGNGLGGGTLNFTAGPNVTSGVASYTFDTLGLGAGSVQTTILNPTTATVSIGTVSKFNNTPAQTLQLDGTAAGNEITGIIANGTATITLTKANSSTWKLSGANTFTGGVNINSGTLQANNSSALGASGTIAFGGGTLQFGAGWTSTDFSSRFSTAASQGYNIDVNGNNVTFGAALTSSGGTLTLSDTAGSGSLTLSGANTYSGATTVTGGKLLFSTAGSAASAVTVNGGACGVTVAAANGQWVDSSSMTQANGTEMDFAFGGLAPSTTTAPMKVSTLTLGSSLALRVTGSPTGFTVGQTYPLVTWTGSGPSDASAFTAVVLPYRVLGNLSVSGNTLYLNVTGSTGPISWNGGDGTWDTSTVNWVDTLNATTTYSDGSDAVRFDDASGATGNPIITLNSALSPVGVTVNSVSHNYTFSGAGSLIGSGSLAVQNGTLTLATANSYTGGTTINGGTLQLSGNGTLGASNGAVTVSSGTLDLGATSQTNGAVTISGGMLTNGTLSGTSFSANNAGAALISAGLTGTGGLTKSGNGTLTLTGSNSFTGSLWAKAGTLIIDTGGVVSGANWSSIGQSGTDVATCTLKGTGSFTSTADFNVGDIDTTTGTLNLQDSAVLSVQNLFIGSANASGSTASGTINMNGGVLIERNTTVGTFVLGGRNSGNAGNGVGVLNLTNGYVSAACGIRVGDYGSGTINQYGGLLEVTNGSSGINLRRESTGGSGTYNLNGGTLRTEKVTSSQTTGTRLFYFNGGNLQAGAGNLGSTPFMNNLSHAFVRNGGAIIDDRGYSIIVSQGLEHSDIAGDNAVDGGLVKLGAGTLTLSGANTYTGSTVVNNGTLLVNGTLDGGAVSVNSGARLGGTGTIGGPVTVNNGGTLQPDGAALGKLTINNSLTLSGSTVLALNRDSAPNASQVAGVTVLTKGGALTVTNLGTALQGGDTFTLFTMTGSGTFSATNLPALAASQNWWTPDNYSTLTVNQVNAGAVSYSRTKGVSFKLKVADLLTNVVSIPAGDSFALAGVGASAQNATLTVNGGYIYYTPANDNNDSFSYTVNSVRGGSATGMINIDVTAATGLPLGINSLSMVGTTANVSVYGIPNYTYVLQTATNLNGPWWPVATNTAAADGKLSFTDANATNSQQFYRTAQP